jgi:colicin import membrane protein
MSQPSSVLFSLRELARMEDERVRAQAEAAERERAAREQVLRDADERSRAEQEARARADAEARESEERRGREDSARAEAMRAAAIEAARVSAEASARAAESERQRRHELEMARAGARSKRRAAIAALAGALCVTATWAGVHKAWVAPREQAFESRAHADRVSGDRTIGDCRAKLETASERAAALEGEVVAARDANRRLQSDLDDARRRFDRGAQAKAPVRTLEPEGREFGPERKPVRTLEPEGREFGPERKPVSGTRTVRDDFRGIDDLPRCTPGSLDPICVP